MKTHPNGCPRCNDFTGLTFEPSQPIPFIFRGCKQMHSKTTNLQIVLACLNILQLQKLDELELLEVEDCCMKSNCTVSIGKSIQNPVETPELDLHLAHPFVCVFMYSADSRISTSKKGQILQISFRFFKFHVCLSHASL